MRKLIVLAAFVCLMMPVQAQETLPDLPKTKATLSTWDVALYSKAFDLQEQGAWDKADKQIRRIGNGLLMGHVLAQRYLHLGSDRTSFAALKHWLDHFADHPQAPRIYALAQARRPEGNQDALTVPVVHANVSGVLGVQGSRAKIYQSKKRRAAILQNDIDGLVREIRHRVDIYEPSAALRLLNETAAGKALDTIEYDQARALIAAGYLYAQKPEAALKQALASRKRSGKYVPLAYWVEGLVQWQKGAYGKAAFAFEQAAESAYASGWLRSAASYWTARAYMREGDVKSITPWLKKAAANPRTFYGLLAIRALGQDFQFDWGMPSLSGAHIRLLEEYPQGQRAKALIDTGQYTLAEEELKNIPDLLRPDVSEALLAYAASKNLAGLSLYMGNTVARPEGGLYDEALFPLLPWKPAGKDYTIDKALIHAFARQESRFRVSAESVSGAVGLMQIMPSTAGFIVKDEGFQTAAGRAKLKDPETNLGIGQVYLGHLLNLSVVDQDLLFLALAYNAGPGKLRQWKKERGNIDDPLMFIETIPFAETRAFVERVMANYWIYQMRLEQPTPSLDTLAAGRWAVYDAAND